MEQMKEDGELTEPWVSELGYDQLPCLSPVKLCHYFSVTGGIKDGSEAVF